MLQHRTFPARCWPEGSAWVVHVPELGRSAQAGHLSQVEDVARDLVARTSRRDDPSSYRVVVDLQVRHSANELITAAAALREDPDRVSVEAVTMRRCLARRLAAEGFGVPDVAALLGLSYGRTLQLLAEHGHGRRPSSLAAVPPQPLPAADVPHQEEAPPVRAHSSYRHEAYLYSGHDSFLAGTLPFIEEGVELGQPVMVAVVPERLEPLRAALPGAPVYWVDMAELGGNPARIIPAWRQFVDEHGGRSTPVRGIGEPIWAGRRPAELAECQLHEALLNLAVDPDTPLWLRCPYDESALDPAVLEEASRSHPALVDVDDYRGSLLYGGVDHVTSVFASELPPPQGPVEELHFDATSTTSVRSAVVTSAGAAGLTATRSHDLALAVTEAATNSVRHGGGRGVLRLWTQDGALVWEVRDSGVIEDPLVGRHLPSLEVENGRGLWLVNQLSDLVQLRSSAAGTTVRGHAWLDEDATAAPTGLGLQEAAVACGR